jgi:hypothetical protein
MIKRVKIVITKLEKDNITSSSYFMPLIIREILAKKVREEIKRVSLFI